MPAKVLIPFLLALLAAKQALDHVADVDLFWHVRLGLDMLARGSLPRAVEYSWTAAGAPYPPNDWLAELALALSYQGGGFTGVALLKTAVVLALAMLLYRACLARAEGNARAAGAAVAPMLFVAATNFIARPVLFGHVCLAAEILALEAVRRGKTRWALAVPPLFALWINLHGSWPVGLGPLGVAVASAFLPVGLGRLRARPFPREARLPLAVATALSLPALLLNPVGPSLLLRPFELLSRREATRVLVEWSPVPLTSSSSWILFAVAALFALACWRSRKPLPLWDLALVALVLGMALSTALYHLAFAVIAAPVFAEQLSGVVSPQGLSQPRRNLLLASVAAASLGLVAAKNLRNASLEVAASVPAEAVRALEDSGLSAERGFNYFDWGGFLVFRKIPTFVDGRLEPFLANGVFAEYVGIEDRGDVAALETKGVRWILAPPTTRLAIAASARPGWKLAFRDRLALLFVRAPAP